MDIKEKILMGRYELGRLLGQGAFAKVYYARNLTTGQSVAIKVIDKEKVLRIGLMNQIKREISVMKRVRHPNILQLYEVMATKTKIYYALEYAKGGELFDKVANEKLQEHIARKYFQQLINAVDFCHSRGVYHRDLKPENLLLDEDENLKVSDFGLSALADSKHQDGLLHTTCGTPAYVAPEVITRRGYDGDKADIWSCGVILYVLLAGYLPFHDTNLVEMYRKMGKAEFKFPSWFQPEARKLVLRMLDPNPVNRITIPKIKANSWFKKGKLSKEPSLNKASGSGATDVAENQDLTKPPNMNAFDIITLSPGFDLTTLFEEPRQKTEARFTIWRHASVIITKLEEVGKRLGMKVGKREAGLLKLEAMKEGKKGILSINAEIFELTPYVHLVEMKKCNGDTLEYQKVLNEGLRPGLQDIIWNSQDGEQEQQVRLEQQHQQQQQVLIPRKC
ncbi:putative protein kinase CAMK-CAMKL-CHK1 family [Helianthus annuus]|uniref:non-specific serine/threonine protein kinase n=1 Tax=Helianthus annuus TaxID=4232 RepID=A0A251VQC6_HELAN|nr:CBL-interacting serine/threonine-protein kinase 10 [Helianthus annuus]KAF5821801.1 putative protein kinase CAMK-CAMKL-CHK1 family [Helianthus annuus]KAJ0611412.1 putative protein kinase CAMK-CAMKL-CHK1 family [Helianthus annuus]KAJ0622454.1 putative protein kinase CAMK-CAMKL-CHK1 family [Helianthus annuus]KAJ0626709.1 putative protein kinase CAMK-CAMKL-CHK1 family [Helianthus annuus]KAJ0783059.1 putative protein kinase CAMK-CAMKL-CHK1 family [Helianthus annuus]